MTDEEFERRYPCVDEDALSKLMIPERVDAVGSGVVNTSVDLSWLSDCGLDSIEVLELLLVHWFMRDIEGDDKESPLLNEYDSFVSARGMARSCAVFFDAMRCTYGPKKDLGEESLVLILRLLLPLVYKAGVRDAFEGRLSDPLMSEMSRGRNRTDEKFDGMYQFSRGIGGL